MMQEWADKLGKGGSRIRVELIALSKPRGLNSFLNVRFVPEADFLKILRAQQLGAGHIKYPQNYREYLKFL